MDNLNLTLAKLKQNIGYYNGVKTVVIPKGTIVKVDEKENFVIWGNEKCTILKWEYTPIIC